MRAQVPVLGAVLFMTSTVIIVRESMQNCDRLWLRLCVYILCGAISYAGVLLIMARHTVLADVRALIGELLTGKRVEEALRDLHQPLCLFKCPRATA